MEESMNMAAQKEQIALDASMVTKLTDVNVDCLEKVCMYLNLEDLLNVANANKHLKQASELVFSRKHGMKTIYICASLPFQQETLRVRKDNIFTDDLRTSFRLLRCFGHLITRLILQNVPLVPFIDVKHASPKLHKQLMGYISEYCTKSLIELTIYGFQENTFSELVKPFPKVEIIRNLDSYLGANLTEFNTFFPNLKHLHFSGDNHLADRKSIETHLPNLKSLEVNQNENQIGIIYSGPNNFHDENIAEAIRLNPQLETLLLHNECFIKSVENAAKYLLNLSDLEICWNFERIFKLDIEPIRFKAVNKVVIKDHSTRLLSLPKIPMCFDHLEDLHIATSCQHIENLVDFLAKHPSIKRLTLNIHPMCLDVIGNSLTSLEVFDYRTSLSAEEALFYLNICKRLKYFTFHIDDYSELEQLRYNLGEEWQELSSIYGEVILIRDLPSQNV